MIDMTYANLNASVVWINFNGQHFILLTWQTLVPLTRFFFFFLTLNMGEFMKAHCSFRSPFIGRFEGGRLCYNDAFLTSDSHRGLSVHWVCCGISFSFCQSFIHSNLDRNGRWSRSDDADQFNNKLSPVKSPKTRPVTPLPFFVL